MKDLSFSKETLQGMASPPDVRVMAVRYTQDGRSGTAMAISESVARSALASSASLLRGVVTGLDGRGNDELATRLATMFEWVLRAAIRNGSASVTVPIPASLPIKPGCDGTIPITVQIVPTTPAKRTRRTSTATEKTRATKPRTTKTSPTPRRRASSSPPPTAA